MSFGGIRTDNNVVKDGHERRQTGVVVNVVLRRHGAGRLVVHVVELAALADVRGPLCGLLDSDGLVAVVAVPGCFSVGLGVEVAIAVGGKVPLQNLLLDAVDAECAAPKRGGLRNRASARVIIYARAPLCASCAR